MNAIHGNHISLPSDTGSIESLAKQARAGDQRSIEHVASEFESLFVSMVLKEMRQTLQPDTMFGGDTSDTYGGLFDMYMSQHVAHAGGFGIGNMVRQYLEKQKAVSPGELGKGLNL